MIRGERRLWALVFLLATLFPVGLAAQVQSDPVGIYFLDVGQGDAVLVRAPGGQTLLVDAGPNDRIVEYLRQLEVDQIDLFIATHNHADHIGGASAVARAVPVRFVMDNGIPHTTDTYLEWLETLVELDIPLVDPDQREIELGEVVLRVLPPPGDPSLGHNDNSIGLILSYGQFRASFGGDAEGPLWEFWTEGFRDLLVPVNVHKASHHGSRAGDTGEAIGLLRPDHVVVSAGRDNSFGHPHEEALALYAGIGAQVHSTAEHGSIMVLGWEDGTTSLESTAPGQPLRVLCIDLNEASVERLQAIVHIGPERAEHIIKLRATNLFATVDELTRVGGIGPARVRDIIAENLACVAGDGSGSP